jgi:hypothetical protein
MRGADGVGDVANQDEAHHDDEVSSGRSVKPYSAEASR